MSDTFDDQARLRTGRLAELGLMTATLTHELRQPLFAIRSLAQLAQLAQSAEGDGDGGNRHLSELVRQTELMEQIVATVGAYARDDTGILAPVDLEAEIKSALGLLTHLSKQKGVGIDCEYHGRLPPVVGEATAILQVLVNLFQNAVDASPTMGSVSVRTRLESGQVLLYVEDQGPGVPADLRERVFEPFFTTKDPEKGTGLGLFLARELIERCRGELNLVDGDRGACFEIRLRTWGEG
ncbi:MAG: HAMP domain-containing sensor histidine kinase [Myxococcota bacterium]|nr:HAMP domain-containing sensor histidine kinase [Myxococcota bacterium]